MKTRTALIAVALLATLVALTGCPKRSTTIVTYSGRAVVATPAPPPLPATTAYPLPPQPAYPPAAAGDAGAFVPAPPAYGQPAWTPAPAGFSTSAALPPPPPAPTPLDASGAEPYAVDAGAAAAEPPAPTVYQPAPYQPPAYQPAPYQPPTYQPAPAPAYQPPAPPATYVYPTAPQAGVEVLTAGPVHEAFAEPVAANLVPTIRVSRGPPAPIQELPPNVRPSDPAAMWIPGYWGWDDARSDYVWVSGIWRIAPPGARWAAGYWTATAQGFEWTPGFWLVSEARTIEYLPPPPASLETGPISLAPSNDYIWISGTWLYGGNRYSWQSGFWSPARADWIWMPAHFVWTPRGCVFVPGYWDYTLSRRGMLFAPIWAPPAVLAAPGFCYTPVTIIQTDVLVIDLFSRPRYHHYYFGDYYDARFARAGIVPWYDYRDRGGWYDPIGAHRVWQHRTDDPRFVEHERQRFEQLQTQVDLRPPRTLNLQNQFVRQHPERATTVLARPLAQVAAERNPPIRLEKVDTARIKTIQQQAGQITQYRDLRAKAEAPALRTGTQPQGHGPPAAAAPATRSTATPVPAAPPTAAPPATAPRTVVDPRKDVRTFTSPDRTAPPERIMGPTDPREDRRPAPPDPARRTDEPARPADGRSAVPAKGAPGGGSPLGATPGIATRAVPPAAGPAFSAAASRAAPTTAIAPTPAALAPVPPKTAWTQLPTAGNTVRADSVAPTRAPLPAVEPTSAWTKLSPTRNTARADSVAPAAPAIADVRKPVAPTPAPAPAVTRTIEPPVRDVARPLAPARAPTEAIRPAPPAPAVAEVRRPIAPAAPDHFAAAPAPVVARNPAPPAPAAARTGAKAADPTKASLARDAGE